jgi:prefoldin subunit 5
MKKLAEIEEELRTLRDAKDRLEHAIDYLNQVEWPNGVDEPHHAEMEMEEAHCQIVNRIEEIEQKLEEI